MYQIRSLSVRLGAGTVFRLCRSCLCGLLSVTGLILLTSARQRFNAPALSRAAAGAVSISLALETERRARQVDSCDQKAVYAFYMFVWKVFYLSYFFLPFTGFYT